MEEKFSFIVPLLFIGGIIYALIQQIKYTVDLKLNGEKNNRLYVLNCLFCMAYVGFVLSFVMNLLVGITNLASPSNSQNTGISCMIFLIILLIIKYRIIPNNEGMK